jgi:plasmid maintenance system antidote protein VapI
MAVLLSTYFGTTDSHWMSLQGHYDLELAKERMAKKAALIQPHPHTASGVLRRIETPNSSTRR